LALSRISLALLSPFSFPKAYTDGLSTKETSRANCQSFVTTQPPKKALN
jgi:hypothetical protein